MTRDPTESGDRQDRLNELRLEYMDALAAGEEIDRGQFVAAHPEFRAELVAFIAGHEEVERMAAPLRNATEEGAEDKSAWRSVPGGRRPGGFEPSGIGDGAMPSLGQLGEFRLLREVGRGGMGVVYEAEQ